MTAQKYDAVVVGGGIFGATAALELQTRGYRTVLLDPGPLPHPDAASTDISKAIRMEYGADETYMAMMEEAFAGWRAWNAKWETPLFHEPGMVNLCKGEMAPGGYEFESYQMLLQRGHNPERLDSAAIRRRFPAWNADLFVDGFYHSQAGYAESGRVVTAVLAEAEQAGATLYPGQTVTEIGVADGRVTSVHTAAGDVFPTAQVVVAAGTWTYLIVPDLQPVMRSTGQPVFHLQLAPEQAALFSPPQFVGFAADISNSGWYGFPIHPHEGILKIANHGPGVDLHPVDDERVVTAADEQHLRAFLRETFPAIQDAPIVYTRRCVYNDTLDEHFWIDRHPEVEGLVVSAGGSGHGFKFAPLLGGLAADALEGKENRWLSKFRWRALAPGTTGEEAARYH